MSNSTEMPTPNPVVDPTYPTGIIRQERVPKVDAQDQPLGTSSSFVSSTHLDGILDIWVRLPG
jgi:hypothetical protein